MFTFKDLCDEIKRRSVRSEGDTQFDTAVKNIVNTSLFRTNREASWKPMRRKTSFNTVAGYTTGSGACTFTNGSTAVAVVGATFLTDGITIGRRIKLSGDGFYHTIEKVTGETSCTITQAYSGTTTGSGTYSILGQEEYNLPIQVGTRMFLWHNEYGNPTQLQYVTDQDFRSQAIIDTTESIPTHYRMWGEDMVREQLRNLSIITIASSSASDVNIGITVFGVVSGYPDYEVITTDATDGTTAVNGSKVFSSVERVVKNGSTVGRITVTANAAATTVAVLPVGDTTAGILYRKVQLWPLPDTVFPINVQYYKDTYRLVNDGDIHELGQDFDEAIILLSVAKLKYENSQSEGDRWLGMWKDEIRSLKNTNMDKIDWFPTLRRPRDSGSRPLSVHRYLQYNQAGSHFGPRVL